MQANADALIVTTRSSPLNGETYNTTVSNMKLQEMMVYFEMVIVRNQFS